MEPLGHVSHEPLAEHVAQAGSHATQVPENLNSDERQKHWFEASGAIGEPVESLGQVTH